VVAKSITDTLAFPTDPAFGGPPTYQNCLRAIGRILDDRSASNLMVMESPDGYHVRFLPSRAPEPRLISVTRRRCQELLYLSRSLRGHGSESRAAISSLFPSSYEDILRAIGYEMDRLDVRWLGIVETGDAILVTGLIPLDNQPDAALAPFERTFNEDMLSDLLFDARKRRQNAA
jgi:hypothetical protein